MSLGFHRYSQGYAITWIFFPLCLILWLVSRSPLWPCFYYLNSQLNPIDLPIHLLFFFFFAAHSFPIGKSKVSFWFFLNATTTTSYKIKTNPVQQTKKTTIRTFYLWGQSLWIGIHLISCLNSVHSSVRNKWAPHFKLFKKASLVTSLYVRLLDSSSPLQRILLNTCRCIIMASTVY